MSVNWDPLVSINLVTPLFRNFHVVTSLRLHLTYRALGVRGFL
jgi:hypothetical protein